MHPEPTPPAPAPNVLRPPLAHTRDDVIFIAPVTIQFPPPTTNNQQPTTNNQHPTTNTHDPQYNNNNANSGFYNGWAGRSNYWETQLFYDNATRGMIIANTMGWVVGLGARLWSDAQRSEDDEGRGRGRSSRSAQAGSRRR